MSDLPDAMSGRRVLRSAMASDKAFIGSPSLNKTQANHGPSRQDGAGVSRARKINAINLEIANLKESVGTDRVNVETNPPRGKQHAGVDLPNPVCLETLLGLLGGPTEATRHELRRFLRSGGVLPQVNRYHIAVMAIQD